MNINDNIDLWLTEMSSCKKKQNGYQSYNCKKIHLSCTHKQHTVSYKQQCHFKIQQKKMSPQIQTKSIKTSLHIAFLSFDKKSTLLK